MFKIKNPLELFFGNKLKNTTFICEGNNRDKSHPTKTWTDRVAKEDQYMVVCPSCGDPASPLPSGKEKVS